MMSEAEDRRQLQDVMLSYAAAVDDRDMARYRACFVDDVEIVGFGEATIKGADAWTASHDDSYFGHGVLLDSWKKESLTPS